MEQTAPPGGPWLPCSHRQALALYQHLFGRPAALGQLQAALQQVRESRACRPGLELPTVLLEMEWSWRAQEQLLWDLELLTGAGLSLFWPPRALVCGLRGQAQCAWSQRSKPHGGTGRGPDRWASRSSRLCPLPQAGDSLSQTHQLPDGVAPQPLERVTPEFQLLGPRGGYRAGRDHPGLGSGIGMGRQTGCLPLPEPLGYKGDSEAASDPCRGQAVDPSWALDLGEARSDRDPRWESPPMPAEPTLGGLQGPNPTTSSSFGDPGSSEFKDLAQRGERRQARPTTRRPSTSLWGRKLVSPRPSGLPSQGLSEPQDPPEGLGWSLGQERAELHKLLRIEIPQRQREQKEERPGGQRGEAPREESKEVLSQREKIHQGQSGEATQALREEASVYPGGKAPQSERRVCLRSSPECQREEVLQEPQKETQGREVKSFRASPGRVSQAWAVAEGEAPTQPPEEGGSLGISRDFCRSPEEQKPQPGGRKSPGSGERTTQLTQDQTDGPKPAAGDPRAAQEGARPPLPPRRLPGPGAEALAAPGIRGSGAQEHPVALPGCPGPVRDPQGLQGLEGSPDVAEQVPGSSASLLGAVGEPRGGAEAPGASKAAWPGLLGREKASAAVSAAQEETALQQLLELHRAARRRRRQAREQQQLWVLERLRLAWNRHCRVHPLGSPPSPAQLRPQEDAVGQRRALREQLQRGLQERTWRLRAIGVRNTQSFQQLLWPPGAEDPLPGEERLPFPGPSSRC
ncbi:glutenin, high molecular weight subunit 12-like isoform X3 [Meles meles]|uniref:glutenin, high molecular weight subunit 12-like isoform X3 n=1 Tax=Meles meles TaxID=9662 RepID=UPI001E69C6F7|nr:glutenin, high molecular weight subunit 12-like isoform X3 [Meles meles]